MDKMAPYLEMAEKNHVELYACGLSLKQFKIDPKSLPKQIHVTKNGLLYDFQLQKKGYLSIEL
jgi:intracellular sulfur oxidation DsrE/DsrF family protein